MKPFVSFRELGELGRLGNQLFQYAALRALSLRLGCEFSFPTLATREWHGQQCVLEKMCPIAKYKPFSWHEFSYVNNWYQEPDPMQYDPNFDTLSEFTNLSGFFQFPQYFQKYEKLIIPELIPKLEHREKAEKYVKGLKDEHECEIVSLHIRRGDNADGSSSSQKFFAEQFFGKQRLTSENTYYQYFSKAQKVLSELITSKVKFLVFTGGSRNNNKNENDIGWCKRNLEKLFGDKFIYSENVDIVDDFCRIMMCDHHVLSPSSSLGWWAVYLSDFMNDGHKRVVVPEHYHFDNPSVTYRPNFYLPNWIIV